MKSGSISFYLGIIALIAGSISTFAFGTEYGFPAGLIFFSMGGMGRLFENEIIDCLIATFVGVGALVFALNFGEQRFGSHGGGHAADHAAPATSEHK